MAELVNKKTSPDIIIYARILLFMVPPNNTVRADVLTIHASPVENYFFLIFAASNPNNPDPNKSKLAGSGLGWPAEPLPSEPESPEPPLLLDDGEEL